MKENGYGQKLQSLMERVSVLTRTEETREKEENELEEEDREEKAERRGKNKKKTRRGLNNRKRRYCKRITKNAKTYQNRKTEEGESSTKKPKMNDVIVIDLDEEKGEVATETSIGEVQGVDQKEISHPKESLVSYYPSPKKPRVNPSIESQVSSQGNEKTTSQPKLPNPNSGSPPSSKKPRLQLSEENENQMSTRRSEEMDTDSLPTDPRLRRQQQNFMLLKNGVKMKCDVSDEVEDVQIMEPKKRWNMVSGMYM